MDTKSSTTLSILNCKCPRCHEGKLFTHPLTYNINKMMEMPENCEVCGLKFTPEHGYYYGAMYVSYAFVTAETVAILVALYFILGVLTATAILAVLTAVFIAMSPINFRLGRAGWIAIFYRYDEKYAKKPIAKLK
jgi:uncharacterized protein (DUF983 family)